MGSSKFYGFPAIGSTWSDVWWTPRPALDSACQELHTNHNHSHITVTASLGSNVGNPWCVGGNHIQKCPEEGQSASTHLHDAPDTAA
jgi:hypothetical protein